MWSKALRSAVIAGGAVASLQLAFFTVASSPGCDVVAGSRTACEANMVTVVGIGVTIMLIATTWALRPLGLETALLGSALIAGSLYLLMRFGSDPGYGVDDPVSLPMPLLAAVVAFGYTKLALAHHRVQHRLTHPGARR
ncbi:hypothetical protein EKO23_06495 [Nocardioides guangzhouensis]|uniref:Uncharacterized protein n=1 Tax=Nocardioides guangzhouensis TaxID=2497878 RepID=A0A4Q4ZGE3_9ACTN|nr:hypothetical protein [Nocardioides guangzhouensis]RYP87247.1 hypothetical protein EKO23_06495 [Nocardioides guangzhouensis]